MNRRLPNPYLDERKPSPLGKLIIRILLIAALVFALLLPALLFLPGEKMLVWYWVYMVAFAVPVVLLLAALTVKLNRSIRSKWPRLLATWLSGMVVMFVVVVVYSLIMVYSQVGVNPVAYYTNPGNGNRLVIMKAVDFDNTEEGSSTPTYLYGGFPMSGKLFYYPYRGDMIPTNTGIDYVEWTDGGMGAAVHITDLEGVEQTISVSFDFSIPLETVLEEKE